MQIYFKQINLILMFKLKVILLKNLEKLNKRNNHNLKIWNDCNKMPK